MSAEAQRGRVAILHLGRAAAIGEQRRVQSWLQIFEAGGIDTAVVELTRDHPARATSAMRAVSCVLRGAAVPEALAWDASNVRHHLQALRADAILCVSARAWHPSLRDTAPVIVLDYVDALSRSYADRAELAGEAHRRIAYSLLARAHRGFEARTVPGVRRVAAGYADAARLDAQWIPIVATMPAPPADASAPDTDVVFVGTLRYPPNIAAVHRLARFWPEVQRRRPGTSAMIAGSAPVPGVRELCRALGWTLAADFADIAQVYARGRVAVVPLDHTAGIQIKVLDAATLGVVQVVSPAALEGLAAGFPVEVAASDEAFVDAVLGLLDDESRRQVLAAQARQHVRERYSAEAWAGIAATLVGLAD